ncbi:hypothetical protein [Mycolicibacterium canariasense]|uniref:hypothetical protein n=1 Tax=Mycolicibacterium canariasense TaxID=228230 RepID=UPI000A15EF7C|nr:hypothetical protein [Mycolicibacterium canariasense]MCV7208336.1 hypothetical protein [Mycolicibacterium canariasense]ORV13524.1 hypothetical protein AWB94_04690 [Mycolicibacterium canariasense]
MDRLVARLGACAVIGAAIAAPIVHPPNADAYTRTHTVPVTVLIAWSGADCVDLREPDPTTDRTTMAATVDCHPAGADAVSYLSGVGQLYGVRISSRTDVGLACEVKIAGRTVIKQNAYAYVDCMGRW